MSNEMLIGDLYPGDDSERWVCRPTILKKGKPGKGNTSMWITPESDGYERP